MIVMAGAFPTDFPFPDNPAPFPAEVIERLPPTYRRAVARDAPVNANKDTIIHRMLRFRKRDLPTDLFWWARMEREAMVAVCNVAMWLYKRLPFLHGVVRRVATR
jgi:hypothetical protein